MSKVMYRWVCYVCGREAEYARTKPPEKEPIEGVCKECRNIAFGFDEPLDYGKTRHNEHKDRKDMPKLGDRYPFTVIDDMRKGYAR